LFYCISLDYGFIRVRFDIPENFPGDKLVTKITATDSVSKTIHSVAIFNVNIFWKENKW
jgi:hypothetical protein